LLTKADTALLQNKAGNYIAAGAESGKVALAGAILPANLIVWLEDPAGAEAYPITTFTWMLFYKKQDPNKAEVLRNLVEYCLTEGQKLSERMGYIPLPDNVIERIRAVSKDIQ
jgi:phosphate transport system substrate-binding protein